MAEFGFRGFGRKAFGRFKFGGPNRSKRIGVTAEQAGGWLKKLIAPRRKP